MTWGLRSAAAVQSELPLLFRGSSAGPDQEFSRGVERLSKGTVDPGRGPKRWQRIWLAGALLNPGTALAASTDGTGPQSSRAEKAWWWLALWEVYRLNGDGRTMELMDREVLPWLELERRHLQKQSKSTDLPTDLAVCQGIRAWGWFSGLRGFGGISLEWEDSYRACEKRLSRQIADQPVLTSELIRAFSSGASQSIDPRSAPGPFATLAAAWGFSREEVHAVGVLRDELGIRVWSFMLGFEPHRPCIAAKPTESLRLDPFAYGTAQFSIQIDGCGAGPWRTLRSGKEDERIFSNLRGQQSIQLLLRSSG